MAEWVFTVSEVGDFVKRSLDGQPVLQNIKVRGEISDLRRSAAGHVYFSLKDERALLRCVFFKQEQRGGGPLSEGMKVTATGRLSFYSEQGQVNFYIREVSNDGVGNLYLLFEQRKERFRQKGYFDPEAKKAIPSFPARVGVVTSPTGAVIRDIIRIAARRNPHTQIVLYPVKVQGEGAAAEIAEGIRCFNGRGDVDVLIVGRGGGSFEDLWEFNDEAVVSAIFRSGIPVITAIGHETDFTLADFAADLRAATPSEAAELAVPDVMELLRRANALSVALRRAVEGRLERSRKELDYLDQALLLHGPRERLAQYDMKLDALQGRLQAALGACIAGAEGRLSLSQSRLRDLSPASVLQRGYAAVYRTATGEYVTRGAALRQGDAVRIQFSDVRRRANIEEETGGCHGETGDAVL